MTASSRPAGDADVRALLVTLSSRLERVWCEAEAGQRGPGWEQANDRLVTAMAALEGYAGQLHPDLGRRDWRCRQRSAVRGPDR